MKTWQAFLHVSCLRVFTFQCSIPTTLPVRLQRPHRRHPAQRQHVAARTVAQAESMEMRAGTFSAADALVGVEENLALSFIRPPGDDISAARRFGARFQ